MSEAAAVVQALCALAIAILTWRLIEVTRQYADTTDRYASIAEQQLKESILTRQAAVQPYLHVLDVGYGSLQQQDFWASFANVGPGPALTVRGEVTVGSLCFDVNDNMPSVLAAGEKSPHSGGISRQPGGAVTPAGVLGEGTLKVRYRDVLHRWWITELPLRIDMYRSRDGDQSPVVVALESKETVYLDTSESPSVSAP